VAFAAVTVKVEELPALTEAGLALMLIVGADEPPEPEWTDEPHPVNTRRAANINAIADSEEIPLRDRFAHSFITVSSFQF
jgi:hypothetical protein